MKKIIFTQIPEEVNFTLKETSRNHFNTPVFCGYAHTLLKSNNFKNLHSEIFGVGLTDTAGDKLIIDRLMEKNPDIIWMPLLSEGNYQRCVYTAEKLKESNPSLKTVAAGPEIPFSPEDYFPENIDIGIFSQKTKTLIKIMNAFDKNTDDFSKINGIMHKTNGKLLINKMKDNSPSIKNLPSPYLSGDMDRVMHFPRIWIETRRGCPNSCIYCYHGRLEGGNESFFDLTRIKTELEYLKNKEVSCISIMDPTFNSPFEWTEKICKLILLMNKERKIRFESNLRCDLIEEEHAELFKRCGFTSFTTGIQTTDMRVLKKISRKNEFKKWLKGVKHLVNRGIVIYPDIIIGLPGDNLKSFKETVNFLVSADMMQYSKSFILFVPPVSRLWDKISSLKVKYQKTAPHMLLGSSTFGFDDIKEAIYYAHERGGEIIPKPFRGEAYDHPQLVEGVSLGYPGGVYITENKYTFSDEDLPISRIIIDLNGRLPAKKLYLLAQTWSNIIANAVVIWFKGENLAAKKDIIKNIMKLLSKENPYTVWNIVLESKNPVLKNTLDEIEKEIIFRPHNLDYQAIYLAEKPDNQYYRCATRFYIVCDKTQKIASRRVSTVRKNIKYHEYRSLTINRGSSVHNKIKELFSEDCEGYLLDFDPSFNMKEIKELMNFIRANNWKKKIILFRDWHLLCLWNFEFHGKYTTEGEDEKIISIDNCGNIRYKSFIKNSFCVV